MHLSYRIHTHGMNEKSERIVHECWTGKNMLKLYTATTGERNWANVKNDLSVLHFSSDSFCLLQRECTATSDMWNDGIFHVEKRIDKAGAEGKNRHYKTEFAAAIHASLWNHINFIVCRTMSRVVVDVSSAYTWGWVAMAQEEEKSGSKRKEEQKSWVCSESSFHFPFILFAPLFLNWLQTVFCCWCHCNV